MAEGEERWTEEVAIVERELLRDCIPEVARPLAVLVVKALASRFEEVQQERDRWHAAHDNAERLYLIARESEDEMRADLERAQAALTAIRGSDPASAHGLPEPDPRPEGPASGGRYKSAIARGYARGLGTGRDVTKAQLEARVAELEAALREVLLSWRAVDAKRIARKALGE